MSAGRNVILLLIAAIAAGAFIPTLISVVTQSRSRTADVQCAIVKPYCPFLADGNCPPCPQLPQLPQQPCICPACKTCAVAATAVPVTACPSCAPIACPACAPCASCPPVARAPAALAASAGGGDAAVTIEQCKALFIKHNVEGDNMFEQIEIDGLLYLLRTYCGHGDGVAPGLVDFPSTQPHTFILDIGSNKGFSLYNFFNLWGDLGDTLLKSVAKRRPYAGHSGGKVTIHAFEPLSSVYAILERVRDHFAPIGMHTLHTHHMAVSNYSGHARITAPNTEESTELASLAASNSGKQGVTEDIEVTTVDGLVAQHKIDHIIHMKVDTEGNDGRVMLGADKTFKKQLVTTAVLEYDRRAWSDTFGTPLRSIVSFLDERGYDTYFIAKSGTLIRLADPISAWWDASYGRTAWSNIWVSKRASRCARKTITAYAAKNDNIPTACYTL